jgi:hypothetical protein
MSGHELIACRLPGGEAASWQASFHFFYGINLFWQRNRKQLAHVADWQRGGFLA